MSTTPNKQPSSNSSNASDVERHDQQQEQLFSNQLQHLQQPQIVALPPGAPLPPGAVVLPPQSAPAMSAAPIPAVTTTTTSASSTGTTTPPLQQQQPTLMMASGGGGDANAAGKQSLMVNYLPTPVDENALREIFERIGPVEEVKIVKSPATLESRGFGFVRYRDPADSVKAIAQLNGYQIYTKRLKVSYALFGAGSGGPPKAPPQGHPLHPHHGHHQHHHHHQYVQYQHVAHQQQQQPQPQYISRAVPQYVHHHQHAHQQPMIIQHGGPFAQPASFAPMGQHLQQQHHHQMMFQMPGGGQQLVPVMMAPQPQHQQFVVMQHHQQQRFSNKQQ